MDDVRAALAFQSAHLEKFGVLARGPVPLLVLEWPTEVVERVVAKLRRFLPKRAMNIVESVAVEGLAGFVYHYPGMPLRGQHMEAVLHGDGGYTGYAGRMQALRRHADPSVAVEGWLELAARMLALGFIPAPVDSYGTGNCVEGQNVVTDGGIVDLGSLRAFETMVDDKAFYQGVLATVVDLATSIREFILGDLHELEAEYRNPTLNMAMIVGHCWRSVGEQIAKLSQEGLTIDPRLRDLFARGPFMDASAPAFRAIFPESLPLSAHK